MIIKTGEVFLRDKMITKTGEVFLRDNECIVGDPCYFGSTECCLCTIKDMIPGTYNSYIDKKTRGTYKGLIKELLILHKDFEGEVLHLENIGTLPVDSGQMGIYGTRCYGYITTEDIEESRNKKFRYEDWRREIKDTDSNTDKFYKVCCNHTLCEDSYGNISDKAVVSQSGYGDGYYPVYVFRDKHGNKVGVRVLFIKIE